MRYMNLDHQHHTVAHDIDKPDTPTHCKATLRFWEIPSCFKCPIVGLCLTLAEQKQLLKRSGIHFKSKTSFQIHEILVASAESENTLSRKIDHYLTRQFAHQCASVLQLPEEDFLQHWRSSFASGKYTALFWAAATRPDLSPEAKEEIYGTIHIYLFENALYHVQARRHMESIQKKLQEKQDTISVLKRQRSDLKHSNELLSQELRKHELRLLSILKEKKALHETLKDLQEGQRILELETENNALRAELSAGKQQLQSLEHMYNLLQKQAALPLEDPNHRKRRRLKHRPEADNTICPIGDTTLCNQTCPAFDPCQKRVLIVGGIARMAVRYRQLIEVRGGKFDYHDGRMSGGGKQLENSLKRADVVLCPVNCNSHAACCRVKTLGKKHNKPVHMMANFSLNAVSRMLGGMQTEVESNP